METIRLFSALCRQWLAGGSLSTRVQRSSPMRTTLAAGSRIARVLTLASPIQLQDQA